MNGFVPIFLLLELRVVGEAYDVFYMRMHVVCGVLMCKLYGTNAGFTTG